MVVVVDPFDACDYIITIDAARLIIDYKIHHFRSKEIFIFDGWDESGLVRSKSSRLLSRLLSPSDFCSVPRFGTTTEFSFAMVSDEALDVEHLQDLVQQQGDTVRALKAAESPNQEEISRAIEKLKQLKIDLNAEITRRKESGDLLIKSKEDFRQKVANSLESRLFYIPSFKIYGGVGGLYDYGESSLVFATRARVY